MEYIDIFKIASTEVTVAVNWWSQFFKDIPHKNIINFCEKLSGMIYGRIYRCWDLNNPARGSGHRSIINDYHMDPILKIACEASKINPDKLPKNIIMLINPGTVRIRNLDNDKEGDIIYSENLLYYNF